MAESANGVKPVKMDANDPTTDVDFLIIGAGPAGASLACFLGKYGFKGLMISSAPGSAHTPRAHIINQPAIECLRDLDPDMEAECSALGHKGKYKEHARWCYTMSGREFGRMHSWGSGPKRSGEFQLRSPCEHLELPQTLLEPILLRYANQHGFPCRFSTRFLEFEDDPKSDKVVATVQDRLSNLVYKIRAKYLFGADGARSKVIDQLGVPMDNKASQGVALNVLLKADMSKLMDSRPGNLHYIMQPNVENADFAWWAIARMVKPWHEWLIILMYKPTCPIEFTPTREQVEEQVAKFIDDDTIPVDITRVDKWIINETVASSYSKGRVYCLGDAVHRHPPMNGLGANTCIQDAANLAWKLALVEKGLADRSLLDTYNVERQPVGKGVVERANNSLREHIPIFDAVGLLAPTVEERKAIHALLQENSERGRTQRRKLRNAIDYTCHEYLALGSDMGQRYRSSAVYLDGAGDPPPFPSDPTLHHEPHTYPGCRLPHAWLNTAVPGKQISTLDLAGKGRFTLFIDIDGEAWRKAAKAVEKMLGVGMAVFSVGYGQDYEAVYGNDWFQLREVEEDGCVLVRPDNFVAWRSVGMVEDCEKELLNVMKKILGL